MARPCSIPPTDSPQSGTLITVAAMPRSIIMRGQIWRDRYRRYYRKFEKVQWRRFHSNIRVVGFAEKRHAQRVGPIGHEERARRGSYFHSDAMGIRMDDSRSGFWDRGYFSCEHYKYRYYFRQRDFPTRIWRKPDGILLYSLLTTSTGFNRCILTDSKTAAINQQCPDKLFGRRNQHAHRKTWQR